MDLQEFKKQFIKDDLGIGEEYGRIISFIDFGNVNNWFDNDTQTADFKPLKTSEKIEIDLDKLKEFSDVFSGKTRIYYGKDLNNKKSGAFSYVLEVVFGRHNFVSKDLQRIKHYVEDDCIEGIQVDKYGRKYIEIRKCNFDVEISVDAIKKINQYDTFCLFSGDADFVYLNNFLKKRGKKIIIIKGGHITARLKETADLVVNAQKIKKYITFIKQKPD